MNDQHIHEHKAICITYNLMVNISKIFKILYALNNNKTMSWQIKYSYFEDNWKGAML